MRAAIDLQPVEEIADDRFPGGRACRISIFLSIFDVDDEVKEKIWDDDDELLKFGYQYIKMAFKIADADALQMKQAMGPGPGSTTMTF